MGLFDRFRQRSAAPPPAAAAQGAAPGEPYLTVRAPAFRDPHAGSPAPLDPHGALIREAFLAGDPAAGWVFRPELDLFETWFTVDDGEGNARAATDDEVRRLGPTRDAAAERARANSATLLGGAGRGVSIAAGGPPDSFAVLGSSGTHRTALLAAPQVFEPYRDRVPGDLLVLPAADDDIMLAGSGAEYLTEAVTSAIGYFRRGGERRLSPVPYLVEDGRLRPWQPPAGSRATAAIREAEAVQRVVGYEGFADDLRRHLGDADVAAAEQGASTSSGLHFSYCTASAAGPAQHLPFVDYIGFENLEPQQDGWCWIRFDRLREVPSLAATPSWQYGLPVLTFEPPTEPGARRELSAGLRERAGDPWT